MEQMVSNQSPIIRGARLESVGDVDIVKMTPLNYAQSGSGSPLVCPCVIRDNLSISLSVHFYVRLMSEN